MTETYFIVIAREIYAYDSEEEVKSFMVNVINGWDLLTPESEIDTEFYMKNAVEKIDSQSDDIRQGENRKSDRGQRIVNHSNIHKGFGISYLASSS